MKFAPLMLLAAVWVVPLHAETPPPATAPADVPATPADDLAHLAAAALRTGDVADVLRRAENRLSEAYTSQTFDPDALVQPLVIKRFLTYFPRVEKLTAFDREIAAWLVTQPKLAETLMLAVGDYDAPDRVLAIAQALRENVDEKTLLENPDLFAALCVVWDEPGPRAGVKESAAGTAQAVRLFHYFTRGRDRLKFDPRDVPWQLQTYAVDLVVSPNEILWVLGRYGKRGNDTGSVYFDVPYDTAAFYQGAELKIKAAEYTLPNLVKIGGICGDQAYFAEQVSRALGVPACVVTGVGGAGDVGHAWVGFLDRRGKQVHWNFTQGRYPQQLYYTGTAVDPQSRQLVSEAEISILSELQAKTPRQRRQSLAIVRSIDSAPKDKQAEFLMQAIDLSPGNRDAWLKLADMAAAKGLDDAQTARLAAVVRDFGARQYADFAMAIYRKMIAHRSNLEQLDRLAELAKVFKDRTDLVAAIRVEQGKLLEGLKRDDDALKAYGDVLTNHLYAGPIVVTALERTDALCRKKNDIKRLVGIYDFVLNRVPKPSISAMAGGTPFILIGNDYAALLDESGDPVGAAKVRGRLTIYLASKGN